MIDDDLFVLLVPGNQSILAYHRYIGISIYVLQYVPLAKLFLNLFFRPKEMLAVVIYSGVIM